MAIPSAPPQRLPLRGDSMAELLEGLELPPGYRMRLSRRTARITHERHRTGAEFEPFLAWLEERVPERLRIECADGTVVVSGMPSSPHQRAIAHLDVALFAIAQAQGWRRDMNTEIWDAPRRDWRTPDLTLFSWDAPELDGMCRLLGHDVVLVTEVTSDCSLDDDRVHKLAFYARTGVPRYLLIDLHAKEAVLFTGPSGGTYATVERAAFGEPLHLPPPIDVTVETGRFGAPQANGLPG